MRIYLAYRWFCGLSIEDKVPDHSAFSRARNERFRESNIFREIFERVVGACIGAGLVGGEGFVTIIDLVGAGFVESLGRPVVRYRIQPFEDLGSAAKTWLFMFRVRARGDGEWWSFATPAVGSGVGQYAIIQAVAPSLGVESVSPSTCAIPARSSAPSLAFARVPNSGLII